MHTRQPARLRSAASTKSWLRICPPKGGLPGSTGSPALSMKARTRMMALCPQKLLTPLCQNESPVASIGP